MNFQGAGRILLWVVVAVLGIATVGQVVRRLDRTDPVIIQSYEVPAEIASEVRDTLASVLYRGDSQAPLGKVSMLPNGHLVVTAPVSVQAGMRRILDEIREAKPTPTPTIRFELWIVTATPRSVAPDVEPLPEIESALEAIRKAKGPLEFELLENLSTVTRSGQNSISVSGANTSLSIRASMRKDEQDQPLVAADAVIQVRTSSGHSASLDALTEMRPGELLVIGQSALSGMRGAGDENPQVYYILRATL